MKESDAYYSQGDSRQHSLPHQAGKKKCKKKKSPIEEDEGRRKYTRDDDEYDSKRKDARGNRRNYDDGESRRKENRKERGSEEKDSRRKEGREHYSEGGKKRCNKYRERRSPDRRRDGEVKSKVKEEILSDEEIPRRDRSRSPRTNHREESNRRKPNNLDSIMNVKEEKHNWGKDDDDKKKPPKVNVAKPDFGLSGKLAEETNVVNGIVIKYSEPEEARKPRVRWRLYPFKGESSLPVLHLHRQSAYLIGRDRKIADLPVDHPSCSKQHAILQYRLVPYTKPDGSQSKRIRPYILDLESANGTFVNNNKIEPKKYVELLERDVIKFAFSSREYVLLHEHSKDAHLDDDVQ